MTQEQMKLLKQIIVGEIKLALSAHNHWLHQLGPSASEPNDWSNYVLQEFVKFGFDSHDPKNGLKNHRPIKLGAMQKELWDSLFCQFPVSEQKATKEQEVPSKDSKDSKEVDVKKELNDFSEASNAHSKLIEKWKKRLETFQENPHIADGMNPITSMGVQQGRTKCLADCIKELEDAMKEQEVPSKEVDVKKELSTLDRNDFGQVCSLVDRIFEDITEVLKVAASSNIISQSDALEGVLKDYMIDLINPDLLDFNSLKATRVE